LEFEETKRELILRITELYFDDFAFLYVQNWIVENDRRFGYVRPALSATLTYHCQHLDGTYITHAVEQKIIPPQLIFRVLFCNIC
jgi:hypothetical protein